MLATKVNLQEILIPLMTMKRKITTYPITNDSNEKLEVFP